MVVDSIEEEEEVTIILILMSKSFWVCRVVNSRGTFIAAANQLDAPMYQIYFILD